MKIKISVLMVLVFGLLCITFFDSIAVAKENPVSRQDFLVDKVNGGTYDFGQVHAFRQLNKLVVTGIIKVTGRYLGHVDLKIINPAGILIKTGSVSLGSSSRLNGQTDNKTTYAFRFEFPFAAINPPDSSTIRVTFHEVRGRVNPGYDCSRNLLP